MTEPISWMVCSSHLLLPDRIIYETQKASRARVSWRINTYPIITRVLDDRLLIPADRTLHFGATLYSHTFERSFHAIKHTESRESLKFSAGARGITGTAQIDGVGTNNGLRLTLRRALI